jgi:hypothetical protein
VKSPEEALAEARARAAAAAEDEAPEESSPLEGPQPVSLQRLTEWAVIEPEETEVYSTRRWGAPITALKKLLVRLMRQYMFSVSGQQTRFNVYALGELMALQERVRALEEAAAKSAQAGAGSAQDPAGPASEPAPSGQ